MRILLSADIHGFLPAYERFAAVLKDRYDAGIIAGDLLDEYIPDEDLMKMLGLAPDDFLLELPPSGETGSESVARWHSSEQAAWLVRGLVMKESQIREALSVSGKPVLVIPGNHDSTALASDGLFINIHLRRETIESTSFVGYGCLDGDLGPERQMRRLGEARELVDQNTILVTHIPPYGTLDSMEGPRGAAGIGSILLARAVAVMKPRLHVFGHVHASFGSRRRSVNAAYPLRGRFAGIDTKTWRVKGE